jgi:hypothetical protein
VANGAKGKNVAPKVIRVGIREVNQR